MKSTPEGRAELQRRYRVSKRTAPLNKEIKALEEKKFKLKSFMTPLERQYVRYMGMYYREQRGRQAVSPAAEDAAVAKKQVEIDVLKHEIQLLKNVEQDGLPAPFLVPLPGTVGRS